MLQIFRMILPEEDFGSQLQHMIPYQTNYPFKMALHSTMTFEGLKWLLFNTMGANLEVKLSRGKLLNDLDRVK